MCIRDSFSNGGQIIYDQFISCGEEKWKRYSNLVLLLPHGYEGQGAEHSSARIERYLQLCADDNIQMVNCTTPAQFFHLLRRQLKRDFRKPLVVFTPKKLLRYPACTSPLSDLAKGSFQEVIDDTVDASKVEKVAFCTGKIYYELLEKRQEIGDESIALVRVEQLFPLPEEQLRAVIAKYSNAKSHVWIQEEPENMGAYTHMLRLFRDVNLEYIGRRAIASSASGSKKRSEKRHTKLINKLFEQQLVNA